MRRGGLTALFPEYIIPVLPRAALAKRLIENQGEWMSVWASRGRTVPRPGSREPVNEVMSTVNFRTSVTTFVPRELFELYGEFDPGSGRTLAARLTHASRTGFFPSGEDSVANGCVTREQPAHAWGITKGNLG